jgi:hypothetical protein
MARCEPRAGFHSNFNPFRRQGFDSIGQEWNTGLSGRGFFQYGKAQNTSSSSFRL